METGAGKPPPLPELSPEMAEFFAEQRRKFREEQLAEEARRYIYIYDICIDIHTHIPQGAAG